MSTQIIKGAEWLIKEVLLNDIFIPEEFNEEQKLMYDSCLQFIDTEVIPVIARIDSLEKGLMPSLLDKAGEQGLLSISLSEKYGGLNKDAVTTTLTNEAIGGGYSFAVALAAHVGIGTLPIYYFGNTEQKQKYIPKLATGEWKASYALTEPGSGSDALAAKTTAKLSADGKHYILNGQKCWITNGGFSTVFTVFAKIDGDKFSAFIVEKGFPGFTQGQEEHKMGIKGSSTVQIFFQDCLVPVENLLGEIGKGHLIAFNILNIGRLKLGAAALGSAKQTIKNSVVYALNREQFKTPIAHFGAIQHKLAEMVIKTWIAESALYRTTYLIEQKKLELLSQGIGEEKALLGAAEEFAVECSIHKVFCSEVLNYIVDEGVQIHGGNGFSDEYIVSKSYRDSRINRIFEGTNEINRLLILDMIIKRSLKGQLDLMTAALAVKNELMSIPTNADIIEESLAAETKMIQHFKKAILLVAGAAVQKLGTQLQHEQEIIMNISDMIIETYHCESALLRTKKRIVQLGEDKSTYQKMITQVYVQDASFKIAKSGYDAIQSFATGDEARMMQVGLKRYTKCDSINAKDLRRKIVGKLLEEKKYWL